MGHNLAALPLVERQCLEIDKRAAFVMWSKVLEQLRKHSGQPMTKEEINDELQASKANQPEHYEYHLERLSHWRDRYQEQVYPAFP